MSLSRNNRPETSGVDCFEAKQNSGKDAAQKKVFSKPQDKFRRYSMPVINTIRAERTYSKFRF
jgi:hypothetical protein